MVFSWLEFCSLYFLSWCLQGPSPTSAARLCPCAASTETSLWVLPFTRRWISELLRSDINNHFTWHRSGWAVFSTHRWSRWTFDICVSSLDILSNIVIRDCTAEVWILVAVGNEGGRVHPLMDEPPSLACVVKRPQPHPRIHWSGTTASPLYSGHPSAALTMSLRLCGGHLSYRSVCECWHFSLY